MSTVILTARCLTVGLALTLAVPDSGIADDSSTNSTSSKGRETAMGYWLRGPPSLLDFTGQAVAELIKDFIQACPNYINLAIFTLERLCWIPSHCKLQGRAIIHVTRGGLYLSTTKVSQEQQQCWGTKPPLDNQTQRSYSKEKGKWFLCTSSQCHLCSVR